MKKTISKTIRNLHNSVFSFEGYDALLGALSIRANSSDIETAVDAEERTEFLQNLMKKAWEYGEALARGDKKRAELRTNSFEAVDYRESMTALDLSEVQLASEASVAVSFANNLASLLGTPKVFLGDLGDTRSIGVFASELYGTMNCLRAVAAN